jgi:hypothetical protein
MNYLKLVQKWAVNLTESLLSLIILFVLVELLLGQTNIPFIGNLNLVAILSNVLNNIATSGAAGIVFVWVLYSIYSKKN